MSQGVGRGRETVLQAWSRQSFIVVAHEERPETRYPGPVDWILRRDLASRAGCLWGDGWRGGEKGEERGVRLGGRRGEISGEGTGREERGVRQGREGMGDRERGDGRRGGG